MTPTFLPQALVDALPSGALAWPHLQRLAERWLRRWVYALTGLALGLSGMWLARPEVSEAHASASQAVERMAQQLAAMPAVAPVRTPLSGDAKTSQSETEAQHLWRALPVASRPETLWVAWQQALAAHGLRLQFLQPMPTISSVEGSGALVSHVASWRVLGHFDDWVRVWAACAESGPACALERINVVATDQTAVVQIDAVMRIWMRPAEGSVADGAAAGPVSDSNGRVPANWMADVRTGLHQSARSRVALFAPSQSASVVAEGASAAVASLATLPDDPHQWPFARVRLAGLWQQGGDRQAVLSAGPHSVWVTRGQRVTLEGHRVVAITGDGVHLQLGKGPWLALPWVEGHQAVESSGTVPSHFAGQFTGELTGPSTQARTTGSPEK